MIFALAITGPTASGKTALSIETAKMLGCEIISLDSMQIYRYMDIGTAKATKEEQAAVKHHMLDFLNPDENYSANSYKSDSLAIAKDICKRGKIPLFVGGTGLYLSTLLRPECETAPESDVNYRKRIEESIKSEEDKIALWKRLNDIDPKSAAMVHYNNVRRVIRALEIYDATGKTKTYFDYMTKEPSKEIKVIHLTIDFHDRENLYRRVDERVDKMVSDGLYEEVTHLLDMGYLKEDTTASQAIGYKEIIEAKNNGLSLDSAKEKIKQASRNYSKRQLTWFRNTKDTITIYADDEMGVMKPRKAFIEEALGIFTNEYKKLINNTH